MNETIKKIVQERFPQIAERPLLEAIAREGTLLQFEAGTVIQNYGSYIKLIPLVLEGSIKVLREDEEGNELFLYYLRPGESCSMSFTCCMMNKKSVIKTVAEENTRLVGIPIRFMDRWMNEYQSWKNFIMTTYDQRLIELIKTIDSIAFRQMDQRLLHYLKEKADVTGSQQLQITHQEIAYDLHASREAISRLLKQLEKDELVKLGRNKIWVEE